MKRISRSLRLVRVLTRSPGFLSSTGPDVILTPTPISEASSMASGGLAQAGRPMEEQVVKGRPRAAAPPCDRDRQGLPHLRLADELRHRARTQRQLRGTLSRDLLWRGDVIAPVHRLIRSSALRIRSSVVIPSPAAPVVQRPAHRRVRARKWVTQREERIDPPPPLPDGAPFPSRRPGRGRAPCRSIAGRAVPPSFCPRRSRAVSMAVSLLARARASRRAE